MNKRKFSTFTQRLVIVVSVVVLSLILSPQKVSAEGSDSTLAQKIQALDEEPAPSIKIPVLFGVEISDLQDTWGNARSGGRSHEGIDIMAARGIHVVSPTPAVVIRIGYEGIYGGNYVHTANPGGEEFYFAHLDTIEKGLEVGDVLKSGDIIGYVGDTGNARGGPTHLHFGIYTQNGAINPYPRITMEFSLEEKLAILQSLLSETVAVVENVSS